jgi:hypothetical protein
LEILVMFPGGGNGRAATIPAASEAQGGGLLRKPGACRRHQREIIRDHRPQPPVNGVACPAIYCY